MRRSFEKLVRDRIPEIIEESGKRCYITQVEGGTLIEALKQKLVEEAREVESASDEALIDELADTLEVIEAIIKLKGIDREYLAQIKQTKQSERGGFDLGIMLHWVEGEIT